MGFKAKQISELITENKKMWIQVKPEELKEMVEKGLNTEGSTNSVKDFLYGSVGVEVSRKVRQGVKSIMSRFGITDAKQLEAALAKVKAEEGTAVEEEEESEEDKPREEAKPDETKEEKKAE